MLCITCVLTLNVVCSNYITNGFNYQAYLGKIFARFNVSKTIKVCSNYFNAGNFCWSSIKWFASLVSSFCWSNFNLALRNVNWAASYWYKWILVDNCFHFSCLLSSSIKQYDFIFIYNNYLPLSFSLLYFVRKLYKHQHL